MVNLSLNLSLNELKLIAEHRNISHYENKSTKDLIKALRGLKPKLGINRNKLKEIKKGFYNLRHEFSKEEADKYRKNFYDIKNYRYLSELEIEEIRKNFNELEKNLNLTKPCDDIDNVYYEDLDEDEDLDEYVDDDKYKKIGGVIRPGVIRPYLRDLINKHKPIQELNNNNNNNNNNNDSDTDRGEWKIQLSMIINCISTRRFKDKRTIH